MRRRESRFELLRASLVFAACTIAGCVRAAPGFEVPSAWPRIGVAHGSIRVPEEMVVGPEDSSMALCLDGICGFEYAPAAGEEAWRHEFREACGHQESPRCDLRASGLEHGRGGAPVGRLLACPFGTLTSAADPRRFERSPRGASADVSLAPA